MSDPKPTGRKIEDIVEAVVSSASPFEDEEADHSDDDAGAGTKSDTTGRRGADAIQSDDDASFTA